MQNGGRRSRTFMQVRAAKYSGSSLIQLSSNLEGRAADWRDVRV
jgi:hypothetical protein